MKKASAPAKVRPRNEIDPRSEIGGRGSRQLQRDDLSALFLRVGQKLRDGLSSEAEDILARTIRDYDHPPDALANLTRLQSFTLETLGRYKDALELLRHDSGQIRRAWSCAHRERVLRSEPLDLCPERIELPVEWSEEVVR